MVGVGFSNSKRENIFRHSHITPSFLSWRATWVPSLVLLRTEAQRGVCVLALGVWICSIEENHLASQIDISIKVTQLCSPRSLPSNRPVFHLSSTIVLDVSFCGYFIILELSCIASIRMSWRISSIANWANCASNGASKVKLGTEVTERLMNTMVLGRLRYLRGSTIVSLGIFHSTEYTL